MAAIAGFRGQAIQRCQNVCCTFTPTLCGVRSCSGLHFVAAIGNAACTKLFCDAGADINLCDKDGARQPPCPLLRRVWCHCYA